MNSKNKSTGQRMLPETLEETSRELTHIRDALDRSAIIAITDQAGRIIHVNDKFCQISKYSREELLGQNHRIINSGYHSPEFFIRLWQTISKGEVWEGEIKNKAKDGSYYWVNTTIVPFLNEKGKPHQYVSIRFEVTQRKLAEAEILMQDRLASIGLLASSLAHEIGTPLGVIRGRAEYLGMQTQDQPLIRKNVDVIISQIDRVSKLIRSLLNLARGEQPQPTGSILVNEVAEEVLDLIRHDLKKHSIEIRNLLKSDIPILVKGQAQSLHQVFLNLIVNAMHAIETAIRSGRTQNHFIQLQAKDLNETWQITLEDSGCGISEANLKNLFKPFFTTKDIGAGTGLGLVTSYRIIEAWGGSIQVESAENQGSLFKIKLPKTHPLQEKSSV